MVHLPEKFDGRITVSLRETGELLGVPAKTIYNCLAAGSFPLAPIKVGRFIFFSVDELRRLILCARAKHAKKV